MSSGSRRGKSRPLPHLTEEELADRFYMADDWLLRQGALIAWLHANGQKEEATRVTIASMKFVAQWPEEIVKHLTHTFYSAWSAGQLILEPRLRT